MRHVRVMVAMANKDMAAIAPTMVKADMLRVRDTTEMKTEKAAIVRVSNISRRAVIATTNIARRDVSTNAPAVMERVTETTAMRVPRKVVSGAKTMMKKEVAGSRVPAVIVRSPIVPVATIALSARRDTTLMPNTA